MNDQKSYRLIYHIGLSLVGLLFVGSLVFYRERMLFVDPAFITFEILQQDWFVFSEHRYGAFITQMFPLIGDWLGLSLKTILVSYSMSFYLFFIAIITVCGSLLKQYKLAIVFCCYLTFLVSDVYFWPNNEVHQAIGWIIGFFSLFSWSWERDWKVPFWVHPLLVALLGLATISHLLIIVPMGFLWVYLVLDKWQLDRKEIIPLVVYTFLILGFVGFRYWLSKESWYDGGKLDAVQSATVTTFLDAFGNAHSQSIFHLLLKRYWVATAICLIGLGNLIYKKKVFKFGLTLLSLLIYYGLVTMTHSEGISANNLFYFESQWMCMSIIMVVPFLFEVVSLTGRKRVLLVVSIAVFMMQLPKMYRGYTKFTTRLNHLEKGVTLAAQNGIAKGYLTDSKDLEEKYLMTWGLPVESLLLSSLEQEVPTTTLKVFKSHTQITSARDSIYTAFDCIPISTLDTDYFDIGSQSSYQSVE